MTTVDVKVSPISFMPIMVRATMDGLKLETRRVIGIDVPAKQWRCDGDGLWHFQNHRGEDLCEPFRCRYGEPGDHLWVKEKLVPSPDGNSVCYFADGKRARDGNLLRKWEWKPNTLGAMYCPRWASRLTLEITDIRVQRLQEISEEDAKAEGMFSAIEQDKSIQDLAVACGLAAGRRHVGPIDYFRVLWQRINGKRKGCTWDDNPWVFAISFKRVKI